MVEVMIVVIVLVIISILAIPSFSGLLQKYRLKGAAETVYMEIVSLRSLAIKKNSTAYLSFNETDPWCYGVNMAAACDCAIANNCMVDGIEKVADVSGFPSVTMTTTFSDDDISFSARTGLPSTAGEVELTNEKGKLIKILVSGLGNIRMCSNDYPGGNMLACP